MCIFIWLILNSFDWGRCESSFPQHPALRNNKDKYVHYICIYKHVHLWLNFHVEFGANHLFCSILQSVMIKTSMYVTYTYVYFFEWFSIRLTEVGSNHLFCSILESVMIKTSMYITYTYINMYICDWFRFRLIELQHPAMHYDTDTHMMKTNIHTIYIYTYVYTHICIYMYIYIYIYVSIYTYVYIYDWFWIRLTEVGANQVFRSILGALCNNKDKHIYHTYVYMYTCKCMYMCIYMNIYIHIYLYVYIYDWIRLSSAESSVSRHPEMRNNKDKYIFCSWIQICICYTYM